MADKGKGKATQAAAGSASPASSTAKAAPTSTAGAAASTSTSTAAAATATAAAPSGPPMHTKGDWTAVWNADIGKYYYWNRKTNTTTWTNPFEAGDAPLPADPPAEATASSAAVQGEASTSKDTATTKAQSPQPSSSTEHKGDKEAEGNDTTAPSTADFGGIDPDLAYLDPSLASRARGAGGAGAYVARFNARTGKFESDPTKNPDRVSDVQRAKRQNQFYFDYDGWQATLAQQQEQNALKRAAEDGEDDSNKKARPSKKEMEAIRARNKEKKDKKQKGWLMN